MEICGKTLESKRRKWLFFLAQQQQNILLVISIHTWNHFDTAGWSNWQPKEPIGQLNLAHQLYLKGGKVADKGEQKNMQWQPMNKCSDPEGHGAALA